VTTDTAYYTPGTMPQITIGTALGRRLVGDLRFEAHLLDALARAYAAGNYPVSLTLDGSQKLIGGVGSSMSSASKPPNRSISARIIPKNRKK
jgi:hypothetical protein